jgi:hypothetical protein
VEEKAILTFNLGTNEWWVVSFINYSSLLLPVWSRLRGPKSHLGIMRFYSFKPTYVYLCSTWRFHSDDYEGYCFLGYIGVLISCLASSEDESDKLHFFMGEGLTPQSPLLGQGYYD